MLSRDFDVKLNKELNSETNDLSKSYNKMIKAEENLDEYYYEHEDYDYNNPTEELITLQDAYKKAYKEYSTARSDLGKILQKQYSEKQIEAMRKKGSLILRSTGFLN